MGRGVSIILFAALCGGAPLFAQSPSSTDVRSEIYKFQGIEYRLGEATLNGAQVTFAAHPSPSIRFHSGGVISGYAGVNQYFARIKVAPGGGFSLESPGFATTKLVGDPQRIEAEAAFLKALQGTHFIHLESDGIAFETDDHTTRLKFIRTTPLQGLSELLNVELVLSRFIRNGTEMVLPADVTITLTFQDAGRFSGRSAVNNYGGVFTAMPNGSITVQTNMATQMAGPRELMVLETAYFDALGLVRQFRLRTNQLVLENDTTSLEYTVRTPR
jgi:heat shock protein HslJ